MSFSSIFLREGFAIFENVLQHSVCDRLIEQTSPQWSRAGVRGLMSNAVVRELAESELLVGLANNLTGKKLVPYKATLFEKTGRANWLVAYHQDTALPVEKIPESAGWGPRSIKDGVVFSHAPTRALKKIIALRIHLDASTSENGPLRVIPGSHNKRILDDREFERIVADGPVQDCTVGKGGVIAMSPLIFHASSKTLNDLPRRVLHIEYTPSLDLEDSVRLAFA